MSYFFTLVGDLRSPLKCTVCRTPADLVDWSSGQANEEARLYVHHSRYYTWTAGEEMLREGKLVGMSLGRIGVLVTLRPDGSVKEHQSPDYIWGDSLVERSGYRDFVGLLGSLLELEVWPPSTWRPFRQT